MINDHASQAFATLFRELNQTLEQINKEGARAFERADYQNTMNISQQAKAIRDMEEQLKAIEDHWGELINRQPFSEPALPEQAVFDQFNFELAFTLYSEYRVNPAEQENLSFRKSKYLKIPPVLKELETAPDRESFLEIYEKLVGKAGNPGLWHSGSLFRQKGRVSDQYAKVQSLVREILARPNASVLELTEVGLPIAKQIYGLGVNVLTEIMHSLYSDRCPVLNNNSLTSLKYLGNFKFPSPNGFKIDDFRWFFLATQALKIKLELDDYGQLDHFLNYIFWKYTKSTDLE